MTLMPHFAYYLELLGLYKVPVIVHIRKYLMNFILSEYYRSVAGYVWNPKVKVGVLRPVQQPGSYWDRFSAFPLGGVEPLHRGDSL